MPQNSTLRLGAMTSGMVWPWAARISARVGRGLSMGYLLGAFRVHILLSHWNMRDEQRHYPSIQSKNSTTPVVSSTTVSKPSSDSLVM